ncbi:hypothetical protein HY346_00585 [Candidatus Microgenomates bacterium]|nr:hypothetical protein [Candidatus Microgenomates bacterium]
MEEQFVATEVAESQPSIEELLAACADVLDADDQLFLADCEVGEALGYVAGKLVNLGKDPEEELMYRGLLEP